MASVSFKAAIVKHAVKIKMILPKRDQMSDATIDGDFATRVSNRDQKRSEKTDARFTR